MVKFFIIYGYIFLITYLYLDWLVLFDVFRGGNHDDGPIVVVGVLTQLIPLSLKKARCQWGLLLLENENSEMLLFK